MPHGIGSILSWGHWQARALIEQLADADVASPTSTVSVASAKTIWDRTSRMSLDISIAGSPEINSTR
jgi:hypothetical protein